MRPLQYKSQYINLRIDISQRMSTERVVSDSVRHSVIICKYLSGISDNSEKNRVVSLMHRNGYSRSDSEAVSKAFHGKASVNQCRRAVSAFIELHVFNDDLQKYCDRFIGLDCSGFVNNYFNSAYGLQEKRIRDYYQRGRRSLRIDFEDFRDKDVLIWCDIHGIMNNENGSSEHIAVIDRVRELCSEDMEATVVESSGTVGLVHSSYTFFKTTVPGVFRVHRPLKPSTNNYVKVVPVI